MKNKRKEFNHIGCSSYPMCEEAAGGCKEVWGNKADMYGHNDGSNEIFEDRTELSEDKVV